MACIVFLLGSAALEVWAGGTLLDVASQGTGGQWWLGNCRAPPLRAALHYTQSGGCWLGSPFLGPCQSRIAAHPLGFPTPWLSQLELRKRQEGSQRAQEDTDTSDVDFLSPLYHPWLTSPGRGILPLLELSRVCHQQLCSQGNQGHKTHSD